MFVVYCEACAATTTGSANIMSGPIRDSSRVFGQIFVPEVAKSQSVRSAMRRNVSA